MKFNFVILPVFISSLFAFSQANAQTFSSMKMCAKDNSQCDIQSAYIAAYGSESSWNVKVMNGPFKCDIVTFGDPKAATAKSCLVAELSSTKDATGENGSFKLPAGNVFAVVYGADKRWVGKVFKPGNTVSCSNGTFGDPAAGTVKSCKVVAIN